MLDVVLGLGYPPEPDADTGLIEAKPFEGVYAVPGEMSDDRLELNVMTG